MKSEIVVQHVKAETIEAQSITLKHPEGKAIINIEAMKSGAGIWVNQDGTDKAVIAIYTLADQTAVGIYGPGKKDNGINVCLSIDKDGNPFVQVVKPDGSTLELGYDELAKLR